VEVRLIGIDCATEDAKVGLARGSWTRAVLRIDQALLCAREESAAKTIAGWLRETQSRALLAIDAPLGWPVAMGRLLGSHRAGEAIVVGANELFRRETDRFVKTKLGKTPLDVGADRIARTAHAALRLLDELRRYIGAPVPLAWTPAFSERVSAIEVYPAATLVSHGFRSGGYKKREHTTEREEMLRSLRTVARLPDNTSSMERNADALDAAVCLLAARDFLTGQAMPPTDPMLAATEGWIWARALPQQANNTVQPGCGQSQSVGHGAVLTTRNRRSRGR
jgi:hypothetical protein